MPGVVGALARREGEAVLAGPRAISERAPGQLASAPARMRPSGLYDITQSGREERLAGMAAGQTTDKQLQREAVALREATTQLEREREASRRGAGVAPSLERVAELAKQRADIARRTRDLQSQRPDMLSVVDAPGEKRMEMQRNEAGLLRPVEVDVAPQLRPLGAPRVVAGGETGMLPSERQAGAAETAATKKSRFPFFDKFRPKQVDNQETKP